MNKNITIRVTSVYNHNIGILRTNIRVHSVVPESLSIFVRTPINVGQFSANNRQCHFSNTREHNRVVDVAVLTLFNQKLQR